MRVHESWRSNASESRNSHQLSSSFDQALKPTFPKCPRPKTLIVLKFFMFIVEDTGDAVLTGLHERKCIVMFF